MGKHYELTFSIAILKESEGNHEHATTIISSPWLPHAGCLAQGIDAQAHRCWQLGPPELTWVATPIVLEKTVGQDPFIQALWNCGCLRISWSRPDSIRIWNKWTKTREINEPRDQRFAQASATIHLWPWTRVRPLSIHLCSMPHRGCDDYLPTSC